MAASINLALLDKSYFLLGTVCDCPYRLSLVQGRATAADRADHRLDRSNCLTGWRSGRGSACVGNAYYS